MPLCGMALDAPDGMGWHPAMHTLAVMPPRHCSCRQVGLVERAPKSRALHRVRQDARGRRVLVPSRITMLIVR